MKKLIITIFLLGFAIPVWAAPTSTIVQNLFISALKSGGSPCLVISAAGLVSTSTCAAGGSGSVSTSSPITVNHFPYWFTVGGGLSGTSTLTYQAGDINVTGTIKQSGVAVLTTSTGLGVLNFTSANISQWTNDSGYLTTSTGLTISNFATTSIGQWVNNGIYLTTSTGLTTANFATTSVSQWVNNGTYLTTSTGLTISNFATTSIGQWVNNGIYLTTSTGLTISNFATTSIGQWANNGIYLTTSTGLGILNFTTSSILEWANTAGYTTYASGGPWSASLITVTNALNVSGMLSKSGAAVLTTSTGLGTGNFTSANITQWTNDAKFINGTGTTSGVATFSAANTLTSTLLGCTGDATCTGTTTTLNIAVVDNSHAHDGTSISGLAVADFTSANISAWTNDAGYTTYASSGPWTGSLVLFTNSVNVSGTLSGQGFTFTNATGTGNLRIATINPSGLSTLQGMTFTNGTGTTLSLTSATSSRCARFNGGGQLVAATGDCTAGDTTGSGAPGGSTFDVQYNNGGVFEAFTGFQLTNSSTNPTLTVSSTGGFVQLQASSSAPGIYTTNLYVTTTLSLNSAVANTLGAWNGSKVATSASAGNYLTYTTGDLSLDPEIASSSPSMNIYDATTTNGYQFAKWRTNRALTLGAITCDEYAAATSTFDIYKQSSLATTTVGTLIATSTACGIGGTTVTAFNTSSLAAGDFLFASTTVVAGTPKWTTINFSFYVND